MNSEDKIKKQVEWYDNPNVITSFIIGLIALIVILSQSFAINNHLSASEILSSILNHNIVYLLMCIYFVALKTKYGKRYFDFLNIFVIVLHMLTAITSLLTLFQSFGLGSLLGLAIDLVILIYMIHTFLRSTRMWKSMGLNKSPFNEISNSTYFNSILVLAVTLLAVNLISTTSFDGTVLTLMDTAYTILFTRYIFLYGDFLARKNSVISECLINVKEVVTQKVDDFVEKHDLEEKLDDAKEKVEEITEDIKEKVIDIKENISDKIEDSGIDEKIDSVKDAVSNLTDEIKEELIELKDDIEEKIEDEVVNKKKTEITDKAVSTIKKSSKPNNEITSRKKNIKKIFKKDDNIKKGNK